MTQARHTDVSEAFTRRDMLKRGAVVGAATLWVAPTLNIVGIGRSDAQASSHPTTTTPTSTPPDQGGKGISFVAFLFQCGSTTYFAKLEGANMEICEGPGGNMCGVDPSGATSACGLGLFTVAKTFSTEGELIRVVVTLTCSGGEYISGSTASKAGQDCFSPTIVGPVATFTS